MFEYIEYFKQETVLSARRFFKTGEKAISTNKGLEKVVMMKQTPRYDPATVDPLCIKPALAELYNNTMTEQWMNSQYKEKIIIGNHNIDCVGAIKESRYRVTKTGKYDGIHLFGSSGRKAYTNSVINILNLAQLTSPDYVNHQTCPQTRYQKQYRHRQHGQVGGGRRNNNVRFDMLSGLNQGNL